jgi:hypothetical protein
MALSGCPFSAFTIVRLLTQPSSAKFSITRRAIATCSAIGAAILFQAAALGAPIAPGNLVVVRIGDGTTTLGNAALPVVLEEHSSISGALVQPIALPTTATVAGNRALTLAGLATSEGFLTLSSDNRYLTMIGYNQTVSFGGAVAPSTSVLVNRVVGRIDMFGNIDTTTALTDAYSTSTPRSATSVDGNSFWLGGTGTNPGVRYCTLGATTSTQLSTPFTNIRVVNIFNNQLYMSSAASTIQGVATVGSGVPTTTGQTTTILPGFPTATGPQPYDYVFLNPSVLYVADDRTASPGGIQKWIFNGTTWTLVYSALASSTLGCRGLTMDPATGVLYATTTGNTLVKAIDVGGTFQFATLATASPNTLYRGLRFIPSVACCSSNGACTLVTAGTCGGTVNASSTCTPNPCPQVACCIPSVGVCDLAVNGICTNGGTPLTGVTSCTSNPCPRDCVVSSYGPFGACSLPCGGGTQTRTRTIITPAANGGQACPILSETISCNTQPCPVDCVVSDWSAWGACSLPCGGGVQTRFRTIITPAANGGTPCPLNLTETQSCNTQPCPINCVLGEWSQWSSCSAPCGGGTQTRTRTVVTPAAFGGTPCGALSETQACNTQLCAVDCVVSPWSPWGACSKDCGGGTQIRTRTIITPAANGGTPCPILQEEQSCNTQPCPVDCVVSAWSEWGPCTKTCGGGEQTRTRTVISPAANGGQPCPVLSETRTCNEQPCPVDCVVSDWTPWGACSLPCGGGTQTRTRTIITQAANGGTPCPINLVEEQSCNTQPCATDCVVSEWSAWSACTATCGGGEQTRTRTIITPASGGGACPPLTETRPCNQQPCAADCVVSEWSPWGSCSLPCGGGTQTRTRTILIPASNGGAPCPALVETQPCNTQACNVACCASNQTCTFVPAASCTSGSPLAPGSTCSPNPCVPGLGTCCVIIGGCTVVTQAACPTTSIWTSGGTCDPYPCTPPARTRVARRGPRAPAIDCVVSDWTPWGACSLPCGGGTQIRTRTVITPAANGGQPCPILQEIQSCNTQPCP